MNAKTYTNLDKILASCFADTADHLTDMAKDSGLLVLAAHETFNEVAMQRAFLQGMAVMLGAGENQRELFQGYLERLEAATRRSKHCDKHKAQAVVFFAKLRSLVDLAKEHLT